MQLLLILFSVAFWLLLTILATRKRSRKLYSFLTASSYARETASAREEGGADTVTSPALGREDELGETAARNDGLADQNPHTNLKLLVKQPFRITRIAVFGMVLTAVFYLVSGSVIEIASRMYFKSYSNVVVEYEDEGGEPPSTTTSGAEATSRVEGGEGASQNTVSWAAAFLDLSGESTALSDDSLAKLADYYEYQTERGGGAQSSASEALIDKVLYPEAGTSNLTKEELEDILNKEYGSVLRVPGEDYRTSSSILAEVVEKDKGLGGESGSVILSQIHADPTLKTLYLALLDKQRGQAEPFRRVWQLLFGPIQILTIIAYFSAILYINGRKPVHIIQKTRDRPDLKSVDRDYLEELKTRIASIIGRNGGGDPAGHENVLEEMELYLDRVEYRPVEYLLWALPSLGFIGTVVGVGSALGSADQVVRAATSAEQAEAITAVTSVLGIAFDTTLVALVCLFPSMLTAYVTRTRESIALMSAKDDAVAEQLAEAGS